MNLRRVFWYDDYARAWVLNRTFDYFSIGLTTSPSTNGHFLGVILNDNAAKRKNMPNGDKTKPFRGLLAQIGFWWFKIYLYIFFDGDGRQ